jgi:hypothetical protein
MESLFVPKPNDGVELSRQRFGDVTLQPAMCDEFGHGACVTSDS